MKADTKEQIWNLLPTKGYEISNHSDRILKQRIEITTGDGRKLSVVSKYVFGKNNLQKFHDTVKKFSIPFCHLTIINGKITRK